MISLFSHKEDRSCAAQSCGGGEGPARLSDALLTESVQVQRALPCDVARLRAAGFTLKHPSQAQGGLFSLHGCLGDRDDWDSGKAPG